MDAERFDTLARALAATTSRREAIGLLAVGALGGIRGMLRGIVGGTGAGQEVVDPDGPPHDDWLRRCAGYGPCQTCDLNSAGELVCGGDCDEPGTADLLCHLAWQDAAYRHLEHALLARGYAADPTPESFILRQDGTDRLAAFASPYRLPHGGAAAAHLIHARHGLGAASLAMIPLDDGPGIEVLIGSTAGVERLLPTEPQAGERLAAQRLVLAQTSPGICSTIDLLCNYVGDFAACLALGIRSCGPNPVCEVIVNLICNLLGNLGCFLTRATVGCCAEACRACEVCDPSPQNLTPFCRGCDPDRCETCQNGTCVGCPDGQQCCAGQCVDLHDPNHCFTCNQACPSGQVCCPTNILKFVIGGCTDLSSDRRSCGSCGNECDGGRFLCCDGQCVNVFTNPDHCGACDDTCPRGKVCANRQCHDCRYLDRLDHEMRHSCSACEICNERGQCEDTCELCHQCDRTSGECTPCDTLPCSTCDEETGRCRSTCDPMQCEECLPSPRGPIDIELLDIDLSMTCQSTCAPGLVCNEATGTCEDEVADPCAPSETGVGQCR